MHETPVCVGDPGVKGHCDNQVGRGGFPIQKLKGEGSSHLSNTHTHTQLSQHLVVICNAIFGLV